MSVKEIEAKISEEQIELTKLRLNHSVNPIPQSDSIRTNRKLIARYRTILTEKQKLG